MNSNIEILGRDRNGNASSQPVVRYGKNRGRRKVEKDGSWICSSGFCYDSRQESRFAHAGWIKAVFLLGHRVGSLDSEGVRDYYVFKEAK